MIKRCGLRAGAFRVHRGFVPGDDIVVEGVLEISLRLAFSVKPAGVGLVVAEEQFGFAVAVKPIRAEFAHFSHDRAVTLGVKPRFGRV